MTKQGAVCSIHQGKTTLAAGKWRNTELSINKHYDLVHFDGFGLSETARPDCTIASNEVATSGKPYLNGLAALFAQSRTSWCWRMLPAPEVDCQPDHLTGRFEYWAPIPIDKSTPYDQLQVFTTKYRVWNIRNGDRYNHSLSEGDPPDSMAVG